MTTTQQQIEPRIRRARVDSLDLYEITEDELNTLDHGSPESLFLLFASNLITIAISFFIALTTTKIESDRTYIFYVIVTVLTFICGLFLITLWFIKHRSSTSVCKKIRKRMKDDIKNEEIKKESTDPTSTLEIIKEKT